MDLPSRAALVGYEESAIRRMISDSEYMAGEIGHLRTAVCRLRLQARFAHEHTIPGQPRFPALWLGHCVSCRDRADGCRFCLTTRPGLEHPSAIRPVPPLPWCGVCQTNADWHFCPTCNPGPGRCREEREALCKVVADSLWGGFCRYCAEADRLHIWGGCWGCDAEPEADGTCPLCEEPGHLWRWCPRLGVCGRCLFCRSRGRSSEACPFGNELVRCDLCRSQGHETWGCPGRAGNADEFQ